MIHVDVPENEAPYQRGRRWLVGAFAAGLTMLSVALELQQRGVEPAKVLENLSRVGVALINPEAGFPTIDWLANLRGLLAVGRNLIAPIVMLVLVLHVGARFVSALYGVSPTSMAHEYLFTSLFGPVIGRGPSLAKLSTTLPLETIAPELVRAKPFVIVREADILGDKYRPEVTIGGPATLIVYSDSAVLLERAGRLTRVVGPGRHSLRRFEKIRSIIDLRPRTYQVTASGLTREGIPVKWPVTVHFQINDRDEDRHPATENQPYAWSESAVFKAATDEWVRDPDKAAVMDWRDRLAAGETTGIMRGLLIEYSLDQLIQPDDKAAGATRRVVQQNLRRKLVEAAPRHGTKILDVTLGNVRLEDPAAQQWVETWKARWEGARKIELSQSQARKVERIETAYAAARREMLKATLDGFQTLIEQDKPVSSFMVIARFVETVRRLTGRTHFPFTLYPEQALDSLHKLISATYEREPGDRLPGDGEEEPES